MSLSLRRCFLLLVLAGIVRSDLSAVAGTGPFVGLAGSWRGDGIVDLADGSQEEVRCKATYATNAAADNLNIDVSCAGDSYKVHILSQVSAQDDGSFSGSWQETTRHAEGAVNGRIPAPGELQASFEAMGVNIQLAARTGRGQQEITIRSQGTDVKGASVRLRRS